MKSSGNPAPQGRQTVRSSAPFGAGPSVAPDPAAYAAGNSLSSLRDLGIW